MRAQEDPGHDGRGCHDDGAGQRRRLEGVDEGLAGCVEHRPPSARRQVLGDGDRPAQTLPGRGDHVGRNVGREASATWLR